MIKLVNCDLSCADHSINKMIIVHVVIGSNLFIISFLPYDRAFLPYEGARPCSLGISRNIHRHGCWVMAMGASVFFFLMVIC